MICFECGKNALLPDDVDLTGTRNGEAFAVQVKGLRCHACGFQTIDDEQSAHFTQLVSDAYRRTHGLLTGEEIRECRTQLGMSQHAFAEYLGVGVASVKRWESGKIQDKAMDELIRLKTDREAARRNLMALQSQIPEQRVLSAGVIGGQTVELMLTWAQFYDNPICITLDRSGLSFRSSDEEELCLAAA